MREGYFYALGLSLFVFTGIIIGSQIGCGQTEPVVELVALGGAVEEAPSAVTDDSQVNDRQRRLSQYKPLLSDYGLFDPVSMNELLPADGVFEYELNTTLFSDYSQKQRLIKLPSGKTAKYCGSGLLEFPVGTIIAKTFYFLADINDPMSTRSILETRILEHRESGWVGIPYVWNEEQSDAELAIAGASKEVEWKHFDGQSRSVSYSVPNLNDCKRCHTNLEMEPIGPKVSNLNRLVRHEGKQENQLEIWQQLNWLSDLPSIASVPRMAVWNDPTEELHSRARAYLDVNCAHCHNAAGPARNSGLHLNVDETDPYHLGTFKTPVAAGKGTGGRLYGIVPGKPDESIMEYRMHTTLPGEIMPEFGKALVHEEGHALIRQWIAEME